MTRGPSALCGAATNYSQGPVDQSLVSRIMTHSRFASFCLILTVTLGAPACTIDNGIGETPGDGATTAVTELGSTNPVEPTGGGPVLCPDSPDFHCSAPVDCTETSCGRLEDRFDAAGCLRRECDTNRPCPPAQVCYRTGDWGECGESAIVCQDKARVCTCRGAADCQESIAYCVPAELGPPTACGEVTSELACMEAGCDIAQTVVTITYANDACVCGASQVVCLWFAGEQFSGPAWTPFFRKDTLDVALLPTDWIVPPHGWERCGIEGAPPACSCAFSCKP